VCGGQAVQPHPDNNPVQWYKPVSEPKMVNIITAEAFKAMDVQQQIKACGWDDVNALYRRSSLNETPFLNVVFAEDMQWAKDRLSSNVARIGYAHANKVWHHHRHATGYTRERVLSNLYSISTIFNTNPVGDSPPTRSLSSLQRLRLIVLRTGLWRLRQIIHWWRYNAQWTSEKNKAQRDFSKAFSMGPDYVHTLCEHVTQNAPQSKHQDS
jgi:rhamnosyltransferase